MTCSLYNDDKMLPMVGLQVSQPSESGLTPSAAIISVKVFSFLILHLMIRGVKINTQKWAHRTTLKISARDIAKWGHKLFDTACPAFDISAYSDSISYPSLSSLQDDHIQHTLKIFVTSGIQPPHPVPAFVFCLIPSMVTIPSLTHSTIRPLVTLWQLQIWVSSSRSAPLSSPPLLVLRN